jgi:hypothetical protein
MGIRSEDMPKLPLPSQNTRLGFHYHPDTQHYRESDLQAWLPELKSLEITWLTLKAPLDRAIPEPFLTGLLSAGIEPVLHFSLPLGDSLWIDDLRFLFETYARWGIHYVVLFDRPNCRDAWPADAWAQNDLVERFLDLFIPGVQAALGNNLIPVFPPLEPGGDYWDSAFLRAALHGLRRRFQDGRLKQLVLSAYARSGERPLDWGSGGPECWPGVHAYITPPGQQDHRGFRIFDWYLAIAQAVLGEALPIMLFQVGSYPQAGAGDDATGLKPSDHTDRNFALARSIFPVKSTQEIGSVPVGLAEDPGSLPPQVLCANFWLLAACPQNRHAAQAWFKPDGRTLPIVGTLRQWLAGLPGPSPEQPDSAAAVSPQTCSTTPPERATARSRPIQHYLLLPLFEWGIADWYLDAIRPFVKKHHPTVGFSLEEALHAARVTIVGSRHLFPDSKVDALRAAGCVVDRIDGDGTSIATRLATS